jgi:hypothetical protein
VPGLTVGNRSDAFEGETPVPGIDGSAVSGGTPPDKEGAIALLEATTMSVADAEKDDAPLDAVAVNVT